MKWLKKRFAEPSTFLGLGAAIFGLGQAFKVDEAAGVAEAVGSVGQAMAGGADPWTAGALGIAGVLAAFMREKGDRE